MSSHVDFGLMIPLLLALLGLWWGVRLRTTPQAYNPKWLIYRQLYTWYAVWNGRDVDESYSLTEWEIRRAATMLIAISAAVVVLGIVLLLPR